MVPKTYSSALKSYLSLSLFSVLVVASQIALPYPKGTPFGTALTIGQLTDESRMDPWAPTPRARKLMVSMFYPVPRQRCRNVVKVPYMPPTTATVLASQIFGLPNGTFQSFDLQVCKPASTSSVDLYGHPVAIYSPGFTSSRLLSSGIAQAISSTGYVVVMMDHPYDAGFVEFPDGDMIPHSPETDNRIDEAVNTRVADTQFVLNKLSTKAGLRHLVPGVFRGLSVKRVAMFGHSLGGATAFAAMFSETRILGGFDLDGSLYGYPKSEELPKDRSFALIGTPTHNSTNDVTWQDALAQVKGWKKELVLAGSGHFTFTDGPLMIRLAGLQGILGPELEAQLGTLEGYRVFKILTTYVTAFIDFVIKKQSPTLFDAESPKFPEVAVL
ncbi:1-alkyl-2-acetylglycerophosphocholine esterase [Drechslerella dactyloides]|uniref:1-alkyl-2-acetylglycerophosphocholine esterase n=1 Tax=Drechslerella dactyloides TaxID=74499 RepID=A0AAD6IU42_DREDA|nr:1-alkyl-2-acetylglycerophosphocholine esterase [Drechslerella dactyloides]